ncbi:MAG: ATP-binding protein [Candidatus Cloacimonadota bacterium]|nr:ATP-binding protein [Candidatus Cloacimonadota bacterium]
MTLVLMIVVFIWAFVNLLGLGRASDAILKENYKSILAAENMIDAIERQDSGVLLFSLGYEDEGLNQYRKNESLFLQWFARAKDNITIEDEDKIINTIERVYSSYLVNFSELRRVYQTTPERTSAFYHETVLPSFKSVRDACVRLREINQETMFKASDYARNISTTSTLSMVIIGIVALCIGLGFSLLLSNLFVRPLRQIMEATQKIAEGNYDVEISTSSSDELGRLAGEFNAMARKLKAYHRLNIKQIVAEKRKSEAIIQSIDDGIVVVDAEFKVTGINPTAAEVFGIEPDKAQGGHFLEVVKSDQLFNYVKQTVQSGQSPPIEEGKNVFIVQQGERQYHYQFSITPVLAKDGSMLGVVLLLRDVTRLKELDRLKSEFVMSASHELRTPLMSIGMSIDLLQETAMEKINEREQQLLSAAHEDLQRLKALVNDLLDLSRIEAGKMDIEFNRVLVPILFEKAVAVLKSQADEKSVELSFEVPEGLPYVKVDPNKITWVLTNLISNALRYTDSGGHIRLFAEQIGPHVHISVNDDGSGIPYEYQSKIFNKFVRVKSDREVEGSGLGLAICREIVRAHGGIIWVDSIPGEGSTFTFTLPVAK